MPCAREVQQLVEFVAAEGVALGRALHLDEAAAAVHDDVHVGLGVRVLGVIQVEHRHAAVDARPRPRPPGRAADSRCSARRFEQRIDRVGERDEAAGDRRGARAAVGLQHVAVDRDRALAERLQVDHRAQRAADQALDLLRAAGLLAARRLARRARMGGARQHAVFGRDPALAAARAGTPGTPSSTLAVHSTRVSPKPTSTEPSACSVKARAKDSARSSSGARPLGRTLMRPASAAPRRWCCRCRAPTPATAWVPSSVSDSRSGLPAGLREAHEILVLEVGPQAVGAQQQHVAGLQPPARRDAHLRQRRIAAQAAFDVVAHRMAVHLGLGDQALAQQHLDMAVVARALEHLLLAQLIDRGCRRRAPSRPPSPAPGTPRRSRAAAPPRRAPRRA